MVHFSSCHIAYGPNPEANHDVPRMIETWQLNTYPEKVPLDACAGIIRTLLFKHTAYSLDTDAVRGRGSCSNAVHALLDFKASTPTPTFSYTHNTLPVIAAVT